MPILILIAASASFTNEDILDVRIKQLFKRRPDAEMHVLTQTHFTKMVTQRGRTVVHKRDFAMYGGGATTTAYNEVLEHIDAAIIFWDGESKPEQKLILRCQEMPLPYDVVRFESLKQELERTKPERKAARKKITIPISEESRQRYKNAHKIWYTRRYPNSVKDGFYTGPKMPVINSGSAMDTFIVNFLVWQGWGATKVNNIGRKVNGVYIPTSTKNGTFDLSATIYGRSIKIETKHGSDRPSEDQLKMQARERNAGAVAEFVYSIEEFFLLYDKILNNQL